MRISFRPTHPVRRTATLALRRTATLASVFAALSLAATAPVHAKATAEERAAGAACLKQLCGVMGAAEGAPSKISCDLSRVWKEKDINKSIEKRLKVKWTLGSAKCGVNLAVPGETVTKALSAGENTFAVPATPVQCDLNRKDKTYTVKFQLAPTLKMKDGKATAATLGMTKIEAPLAIKAVLWSASKLDSSFGAFEGSIVKEVNKFLTKGCAKLK